MTDGYLIHQSLLIKHLLTLLSGLPVGKSGVLISLSFVKLFLFCYLVVRIADKFLCGLSRSVENRVLIKPRNLILAGSPKCYN